MKIINDLSAKQTEKSVVTFGNFDGIHLGHQRLFSKVGEISKANNMNSIVITFKKHTTFSLKNNMLINLLITDLKTKISLIEKYNIKTLYLLDFTEIFKNITAIDFINLMVNNLKAEYIIVGPNCCFGEGALGNAQFLKNNEAAFGYKTIIIDYVKDPKDDKFIYSSSAIRQLIKEGNIVEINKILRRQYKICGTVIKNSGRGTTIGIPTVNIRLPESLLPLKLGVYLAKMRWQEKFYSGIMNIGKRPTVNSKEDIMLEIHLFNFSQNIYGEAIEIYPEQFIREEKKFNNIAELKNQINKDIEAAKKLKASAAVEEIKSFY